MSGKKTITYGYVSGVAVTVTYSDNDNKFTTYLSVVDWLVKKCNDKYSAKARNSSIPICFNFSPHTVQEKECYVRNMATFALYAAPKQDEKAAALALLLLLEHSQGNLPPSSIQDNFLKQPESDPKFALKSFLGAQGKGYIDEMEAAGIKYYTVGKGAEFKNLIDALIGESAQHKEITPQEQW